MINKFLTAIFLTGIMAAFMPVHSFAATLGLSTESPTLGASFASIDYLEFGSDGDLSTFGAEVDFTDGISSVGITEIGFGMGFSLIDPTVGATSGFDVFNEDGLFLAGDLIAVGFTENIIELQFANLSGLGSGSFGSSVLALITFDDALGPNPFVSLIDGEFYTASVSISNVANISSVPLPAALPLFLSALVGLGWVGKWCGMK